MNENKRMSSIARKINWHFWFRQFIALFFLNAVLLGILLFFFCRKVEMQIPEDRVVVDRGVRQEDTGEIYYVAIDDNQEQYRGYVLEYIKELLVPGSIFLGMECFILLLGIGDVKVVRRRLRPLNELARKAEALSSLAIDPGRFNRLEEAISNIRPEAPNDKVHVHDKDLQSLEVAVNNLLERMRETYRQQNRFVSDASHELRTPIAVIQGYVNMLDRWGKDDPEVLQEAIEAMKNESEHMKNLVEQLLFLARGDSGRNILNREQINLFEVMKEVWEEYSMIDSKHRYCIEPEDETVLVNADLAMLKQSIRIFADNARKYASEGTEIKFAVRKEEEGGCYLVQDEGIGMEQEEVVHIFERFYRSDSARNSKTGGTGLGLSIAKWIIDAHGGRIEVLSRVGIGTRFTIHL